MIHPKVSISKVYLGYSVLWSMHSRCFFLIFNQNRFPFKLQSDIFQSKNGSQAPIFYFYATNIYFWPCKYYQAPYVIFIESFYSYILFLDLFGHISIVGIIIPLCLQGRYMQESWQCGLACTPQIVLNLSSINFLIVPAALKYHK